MTKQMKSPKKALPYRKLLDYFRDANDGNPFGKGAEGRLIAKDELIESRGMGQGGPDDENEAAKERRRRGITKKKSLDEKFVTWEKKHKPGSKNYAKSFINWVKSNHKDIAKIGLKGTALGIFTEIMKPTEAGAATLEDVGLKKSKVEKKSTGGMVINKRKLRKPRGVGRALRGYGRALR